MIAPCSADLRERWSNRCLSTERHEVEADKIDKLRYGFDEIVALWAQSGDVPVNLILQRFSSEHHGPQPLP